MQRKLWVILLAVWLLLWGLFQVSNFALVYGTVLLGFLALAVAVLAVFDR